MSMISTAAQFGAVIEIGPQDWQIIQQKNGKADIFLSGRWYIDIINGQERVFAKVVEENTNSIVIPYTSCKLIGEYGWEVVLKNVPAGGLYRIEVCLNNNDEGLEWSNRGDMVHHIGVGDLFVIAGQSNAAGFGRDSISDVPELGIHQLKSNGKWDIANHPLADSTGTLHPVNRERVNPGHSPYLNFSKQLKKKLNYPIGLIPAAKGGSSLASWNPDETGELYHNMMEIIKNAGGVIKGILWYQGCSDTNDEYGKTYFIRFENFVQKVRAELHISDLPFLTVQINRYVDGYVEKNDNGWGIVREAQRQAARNIPGVYVIPSIDAALCDIIHNSAASNMVIGERLAKVALKYIYGHNVICDAPEISSAKRVSGNKVLLDFQNVIDRLNFRKVSPDELPFTIEDEEGQMKIKGYEITNSFLIELNREIKGKACISCASEQCPKFQIPFDSVSYLPLLAFYNVEII